MKSVGIVLLVILAAAIFYFPYSLRSEPQSEKIVPEDSVKDSLPVERDFDVQPLPSEGEASQPRQLLARTERDLNFETLPYDVFGIHVLSSLFVHEFDASGGRTGEFTMTGTVVNSSGEAVSQARVMLESASAENPALLDRFGNCQFETMTDYGGRFSVSANTDLLTRLTVMRDGYLLAHEQADWGESGSVRGVQINLRERRDDLRRIHVRTPSGELVRNSRVWLRRPGQDSPELRGETNRYGFTNLSRVSDASELEIGCTLPFMSEIAWSPWPVAQQGSRGNLVTPAYGVLDLTVSESDAGKPVTGYALRIRDPKTSLMKEETLRYDGVHAEGSVQVKGMPLHDPVDLQVIPTSPDLWPSDWVRVEPGTASLQVFLSGSHPLVVEVKDSRTGEALEGALCEVVVGAKPAEDSNPIISAFADGPFARRSEAYGYGSEETGPDGQAVLRGDRAWEEFFLRVTLAGYAPLVSGPWPSDSSRVECELIKGSAVIVSLEGWEDQEYAKHAVLRSVPDARWFPGNPYVPSRRKEVEDGQVHFRGLPTGVFDVLIFGGDAGIAELLGSVAVTVPGETVRVSFSLGRFARSKVKIQVRASDLIPDFEFAHLSLYRIDRNQTNGSPDCTSSIESGGKLVLQGEVTPGRYILRLEYSLNGERSFLFASGQLDLGANTELEVTELVAGHSTVTFGRRVNGVVQISVPSAGFLTALAASGTSVVLRALPPGDVVASLGGEPLLVVSVEHH